MFSVFFEDGQKPRALCLFFVAFSQFSFFPKHWIFQCFKNNSIWSKKKKREESCLEKRSISRRRDCFCSQRNVTILKTLSSSVRDQSRRFAWSFFGAYPWSRIQLSCLTWKMETWEVCDWLSKTSSNISKLSSIMLYEIKTNFWRKDQKNGQTKMSGFENRGEFEFLVSVGFSEKSLSFSGIIVILEKWSHFSH